MSKQTKIILLLVLFVLVLFLYLFFSSKKVSFDNAGEADKTLQKSVGEIQKVDLKKISNNYKKETKIIFSDYEELVNQIDSASSSLEEESGLLSSTSDERLENEKLEKISRLKNALIDLKVPTEFKDLHLNFVLAMAKTGNYIKDGIATAKNSESLAFVNGAKIKYDWLNK